MRRLLRHGDASVCPRPRNLARPGLRPLRVGNWSLTSLQPRIVKTHGPLANHARHYGLLRMEGHLTGRLFRAMVQPTEELPAADRIGRGGTVADEAKGGGRSGTVSEVVHNEALPRFR